CSHQCNDPAVGRHDGEGALHHLGADIVDRNIESAALGPAANCRCEILLAIANHEFRAELGSKHRLGLRTYSGGDLCTGQPRQLNANMARSAGASMNEDTL